MKESKIEKMLVQVCSRMGWEAWKLTSPSRRGVPDRLVIANGTVAFIEVKATSGKPRPLQRYYLNLLAERGHFVRVVDSEETIVDFVREFDAYIKDGTNKENTIEVEASQVSGD